MSALGRIVETDGAPAAVMQRVCAWCRKDMGAAACDPSQHGLVTHGMCRDCEDLVRSDAGLPSLANVEPAAQVTVSPPQVTGSTAGGSKGSEASEHLSGGPGSASASPHRPLFWTVAGRDFGRANAWARRQPLNLITAQMRAHLGGASQ